MGTVDGLTGGEIGSIITVRGAGLQPKLVASHLDYNPALGGNAIWIVGMTGTENIMQYATEVTGQYYSLTTVFRVSGLQQFWSQTSTGRYLTPLGELAIQGSDVRIKKDFTPPKEGAWDRVKSIGICEFKYKGQNVTKRGFLAQQMGEIDPVYTFEGGTAHDDDGNEFEILNVNDKAVLADVITVVQMMQDKIEAMEAEIAELKVSK
ncbi:chaperone of endosialidase [Salmonella phage Kenya-K38]|nr:chaperone of endosialidase [Salmonella phage Kenya-K38]